MIMSNLNKNPIIKIVNHLIFKYLIMKKIFLSVSLILTTSFVFSQSLGFASGESKKGYSKIYADISTVCNTAVPLQEVNTNGGLDNLTSLADKSATVGISQIDTWQSLSNGDEAIGRLKAVMSLNHNLMHIVVKKSGYNAGRQCSGKEVFNKCIGGDWQPVLKIIEKETDLKELNVAAVGSAQLLARSYLNKKLALNINIIDVDAKPNKSGDAAAFEMLKAGQVDAVITMAAYPSGPVSALKQTDDFTLALFTQPASGSYKIIKKNYKNLGTFNVPFLSVPNILWARPVDPNGSTGQQISRLKSCITSNLKKFQDDAGFESSWADAKLTLPDDVPAWSGMLSKAMKR
jgi:TRAP-type uncharacterized transport system substrate-binding protein